MIQGLRKNQHSITSSKRVRTDRRTRPTPIISRYTFAGGKRRLIRRMDDNKRYIFVDLYSTRLLVIVLSLLILSCLDAYLTLSLIHHGIAVEANPFMAILLSYGIYPFIMVKFALTAFALLALCIFKNAKLTRIGLPIVVKIYIGIVIYELYLFMI